MKIFYDISVLGVGRYNPLARTGVARVVENIAYGIAALKECDLFFCGSLSFQVLNACLDYWESNSRLKNIPLDHSSFLTRFESKLHELSAMLDINNKINDVLLQEGYEKELAQNLRHSLEITNRLVEDYYYILSSQSWAKSDIFHATFYPIPDQLRSAKNTQKFLSVYDLISILYPQFFGKSKDKKVAHSIDSLGLEDWVLCISNATKDDLCNFKKIDTERVFVTHLAADKNIFYQCYDSNKKISLKTKYSIPEGQYILGVSTLEPRKNLDHVIRCFAKLVQEQKIKDLSLVLVGNKGWNYEKIFEEISNQHLLKSRIILTGYVADDEMAALYSGALAFVYPSFYEGFGLPPLEAMQCGVPVITSNTSSLPEVVGDAGIMLDPTDADGFCHSVLEIYNNSSLREAMSLKSLEQAKKFSWEKCSQETMAAYKFALHNK